MPRLTAALSALILGAALAAPCANAQNIALDFTYASTYYWRGGVAGGASAMPSVDLSYALTPRLSAGLNMWIARGSPPDIEGRLDDTTSEIDYTFSLAYSLGNIGVYAGMIDYVIPIGAPFVKRHVLEGHVGVDTEFDNFSVGIGVYRNVDGDEDDSLYIAPSLSYPLGRLDLGLTIGLGNGVYTEEAEGEEDAFGLVDTTPSVGFSVPLGGGMEASVVLALGIGDRDEDAGAYHPFFSVGARWNWSP